MEAEIGVRQPQVTEHLQLSEAGRGKQWILFWSLGGKGETLISAAFALLASRIMKE